MPAEGGGVEKSLVEGFLTLTLTLTLDYPTSCVNCSYALVKWLCMSFCVLCIVLGLWKYTCTCPFVFCGLSDVLDCWQAQASPGMPRHHQGGWRLFVWCLRNERSG